MQRKFLFLTVLLITSSIQTIYGEELRPEHEQLDRLSKIMLEKALQDVENDKRVTEREAGYIFYGKAIAYAPNNWGNDWSWRYKSPDTDTPTSQVCTCTICGMTGLYPDVLCWWINILKNRNYETLQELEFKNRLLLYGPPGNGKTRIAATMAEITNAHFISISTPTIVQRYVGDGVKNIEKIKTSIDLKLNPKSENNTKITDTTKPIIVFFDEIDALAGNNSSESRQEHNATLQHLWKTLDEYENNHRVFVIFATNHIDILNKAFLNRFDDNNKIEIKNPDAAMRKELIKKSFEKSGIAFSDSSIRQNTTTKLIFSTSFLHKIVQESEGFSIRQILGIIRSAKVIADLRNKGQITEEIILQVLARMRESSVLERQEEENDLLIKQFESYNKRLSLTNQIRQIYRTYHKLY